MGNNSIPQKTIFLGALSFWIFGYAISLIILFLQIEFEVVWTEDTFFTLFTRPLLTTLLVYSPLYILPLLLAKHFKGILSVILSLLIAFLPSVMLLICMADSSICRKQVGVFIIATLIQIIFCLVIYTIFIKRKERIVSKLITVSLLFFFIIIGYIAFVANIASQTGPILEELSQQAIEARDVSLCKRILEESKKRHASEFRIGSIVGDNYIECVQKIAVETGDVELCKKIDIGFADMRCIGLVAAKTSNPNLCDLEVGKKSLYNAEYYINECLEAYNSAK